MTETLAAKNQKYWNKASQDVFKDKWVHDLQAQISEYLAANHEWIGLNEQAKEGMKLLDYACGNGIVSRTLHGNFSKCIGVDLSDGMLAKYRATADELGLPESRMVGVQGDLLAPKVGPTTPLLSDEELHNFDLVAVCMALHHFEDVQWAVSRLTDRLRSGGVLLIIDWATYSPHAPTQQPQQEQQDSHSDNHHHHHHQHHHHGHHNGGDGNNKEVQDEVKSSHPASHTISHGSFTEEHIRQLYQTAGCVESSFVLADRLSDVPGAHTGKMQLFWARATKA